MSRSARLFELLQALRRRRRPVTAMRLAEELGVSLRTIYRDVATLVAQGADIQGEAGLGYVLRPGFFLPPLMFNEDEADALLLGLRMVAVRGDAELAQAATDALAKVEAVLPPEREQAAENGLIAGVIGGSDMPHLAAIRRAMRLEQKLLLGYRDKGGAESRRMVWPVAVGFFETAEVLAAWCELRRDFRHFRLDRIETLTPTSARMPRRRRILLAEWRLTQALDDGR